MSRETKPYHAARTSTVLVATGLLLLLAAIIAPPIASAHVPTCYVNGSGDLDCPESPPVDDWLTCGQTPSTWPMCTVTSISSWCSANCFRWEQLVFAIIFHCVDHARVQHNLCTDAVEI